MRTIPDLSIKELVLAVFLGLQELNSSDIDGRTKIQKMFFLLKKDFNLSQNFEYRLYTYGPYSEKLQDDLDTLVSFELIENKIERVLEYRKYCYSLTNKGRKLGIRVYESLDSESKSRLDTMIDQMSKMRDLSLTQIVDKAYERLSQSGL